MSDSSLLPRGLQKKLAAEFCATVEAVVRSWQVPVEAVDLSSAELTLALRECQKDLDILLYRRAGEISVDFEDFDGVSIGKLAGALAFRLARYRVVHLASASVAGMPKGLRQRCGKLQEVAVMRFIWESVLKISPPRTQPELLYLLSRRHMNQEMIGLTFDVYSERCDRLKTRTPLDQAPFNRLFKHA
jgi:hypothetical protein